MHGDAVPLFFFSDLFLRHPEVRDMFPVSMTVQRDRFLHALATVVAQADNLGSLRDYLRGLGRDHRKFGALADHFPAVRISLLATLAHFSEEAWTPELSQDWAAAYDAVAEIMIAAARDDEAKHPAFWEGTVVAHELRRFDIATFRVVTSEPLNYLPGQSVSMESEARPRIWRLYSMANAPRDDQTIDFHVRMVDGGALSMVLTRGLAVGSRLRIGAPLGAFTFDTGSGRDVLFVAGSTGLAPIKAIVDQIAGLDEPPQVHLFFGARTVDGLYDLTGLEKMTTGFPWLRLTPVVSGEPRFAGECGLLPDVVARAGSWRDHDAYVAGPTGMVEATAGRLTAMGVPAGQVHVEDFGWSEL
jgi:NAD(P)H-flavin reductase/hemoglobin-like flavoprotein